MHNISLMTFANSVKMILKKSLSVSFTSNDFRRYIINDLSKENLEENDHMLNIYYQWQEIS